MYVPESFPFLGWTYSCCQYPVFEAAITGRTAMEGSWDEDQAHIEVNRASGLIDMNRQTEEEMKAIRDAVVTQDGLILSVLDVLRRVPRRVLMVLKVNDLTRYVYIFVTGPC